MRGDEHVREIPKRRRRGQRLGGEDVEVRPGEAPLLQAAMGVLVDQLAARHVDQVGVHRQTGEGGRIDKPTRRIGERAGEDEPVGLRQHRGEPGRRVPLVNRICWNARLTTHADDVQSERLPEASDRAADGAEANDDHHLTAQVARHDAGARQRRPFMPPLRRPPVWESPCQREQPGDRRVGDGLRGGAGRRRQAHTACQEPTEHRVIDAGVRQMQPTQVRRVQQAAEEPPGEHGVVVEDAGEAGDLDLRQERWVEPLLRVGRQREQREVESVLAAQRVEARAVIVEERLVDETVGHGGRIRDDEGADCQVPAHPDGPSRVSGYAMSTTRKPLQLLPVVPDQGVLLQPAPPLDLSFGCECLVTSREFLRIGQRHGAATPCVTAECT